MPSVLGDDAGVRLLVSLHGSGTRCGVGDDVDERNCLRECILIGSLVSFILDSWGSVRDFTVLQGACFSPTRPGHAMCHGKSSIRRAPQLQFSLGYFLNDLALIIKHPSIVSKSCGGTCARDCHTASSAWVSGVLALAPGTREELFRLLLTTRESQPTTWLSP